MIQVLIVARLPIIREGLRGLLGAESDLQVTALARTESGPSVEDIISNRPDVVLLDVQVLEQEGWEMLRELSQLAPDLAILIISDAGEDRRVPDALALGARGYISRDAAAEEVASAIRAARQGLYVLESSAAQVLLNDMTADPSVPSPDEAYSYPARPPRSQDLIEPLSSRELDVLRLMVRGMPNKQIASELIITEHTVKFHIRSILSKLGASNRTEAVTIALQKGLVAL